MYIYVFVCIYISICIYLVIAGQTTYKMLHITWDCCLYYTPFLVVQALRIIQNIIRTSPLRHVTMAIASGHDFSLGAVGGQRRDHHYRVAVEHNSHSSSCEI